MEIDVRTITDGEVAAWCSGLNTGFLNPAGDVDAEARRPGTRSPAAGPAAGLIDEHSTSVVARADVMFRSPITPWCSTWF
jgi:hypothetical protein